MGICDAEVREEYALFLYLGKKKRDTLFSFTWGKKMAHSFLIIGEKDGTLFCFR